MKPKITSNILLASPRADRTIIDVSGKGKDTPPKMEEVAGLRKVEEEGWTQVPPRKRNAETPGSDGNRGRARSDGQSRHGLVNNEKNLSRRIRKPLRLAAVMMRQKEGFTYADVLKRARKNISLDALAISTTKIRRAANGGMIIEVLGQDGSNRTNDLAEKLRIIMQEDAKVTRPTIKGEIRLIGLDSVITDEVAFTIEDKGGCRRDDIKVGAICSNNFTRYGPNAL